MIGAVAAIGKCHGSIAEGKGKASTPLRRRSGRRLLSSYLTRPASALAGFSTAGRETGDAATDRRELEDALPGGRGDRAGRDRGRGCRGVSAELAGLPDGAACGGGGAGAEGQRRRGGRAGLPSGEARRRTPATSPRRCCAMPAPAGSSSGHSERRQNHGETDELVREKTLAAVEAGLTPIVCVGENADQRAGGQETEVVGWQLAGSLPKPFRRCGRL